MSRATDYDPTDAEDAARADLSSIAASMVSIAASLATIAAGPYCPRGGEVVAVRDAAGCSIYAAHDALVYCKGDQDAAVQRIKNKR